MVEVNLNELNQLERAELLNLREIIKKSVEPLLTGVRKSLIKGYRDDALIKFIYDGRLPLEIKRDEIENHVVEYKEKGMDEASSALAEYIDEKSDLIRKIEDQS